MGICLKDLNSSAYQYQVTTQGKFNAICEPLFKFGVKYFTYGKEFQDGRYLIFINNLDYYRVFLENVKDNGKTFTKQINNIQKNKLYYYYVSPDIKLFNKEEDLAIRLAYDFNVWNAFFIYKGSHTNFIEFYGFAGERRDEFFHSFCLNNLAFLNHFCDYFNEKAADLIDCKDQSKLGYFDQQLNLYNASQEDLLTQKRERFLQQTDSRKKILRTPAGSFPITKREVQCLTYSALGKSAKEIAKALDLAPRSIESYFQNLTQKSGLKRGELLTYFVMSNPTELDLIITQQKNNKKEIINTFSGLQFLSS